MEYAVHRKGIQVGTYDLNGVIKAISAGDLQYTDIASSDDGSEVAQVADLLRTYGVALSGAAAPVADHAVSAPPVALGPPKSRTTYVVLGLLLGGLGVHNFYSGHHLFGGIKLAITVVPLFAGLPTYLISLIWSIVDVITVKQDAAGVPFV